jgi:hypothetical protein
VDNTRRGPPHIRWQEAHVGKAASADSSPDSAASASASASARPRSTRAGPGSVQRSAEGLPTLIQWRWESQRRARELYSMSAENLKPDSNLKVSQVSKSLTRGGRHAPRAFPLPAVRGSRRKGGFHRLILGLNQRGPDREACSYQPRDSPHLFSGDRSPNVGPRAVPKNAEVRVSRRTKYIMRRNQPRVTRHAPAAAPGAQRRLQDCTAPTAQAH